MLGALGDSLICPDVTGVIEKGEEVLNGLKVTRYAAGDVDGSAKDGLYETDGDFRGDKKVEFHEYWVDSAGQLLQDRISWYLLAQEADFRNIISGVGTTTYLEVGGTQRHHGTHYPLAMNIKNRSGAHFWYRRGSWRRAVLLAGPRR